MGPAHDREDAEMVTAKAYEADNGTITLAVGGAGAVWAHVYPGGYGASRDFRLALISDDDEVSDWDGNEIANLVPTDDGVALFSAFGEDVCGTPLAVGRDYGDGAETRRLADNPGIAGERFLRLLGL